MGKKTLRGFKKMKNILIVSHGAALGGSPISALNIGRFVNKQIFNPIFVFGEDNAIATLAKKEGFKVYIVKKRGFLSIPSLIDFIKIIQKDKIDLIHLNTLTSYYKYPAIAAKLLLKKVVWFIRENPEERRCLKLKKYLNYFSDKIVTVSFDTANHMPYVNKKKLMTIHNGIDLSTFQRLDSSLSYKTLNLDPNFSYITTIASLEKRKGILDLLQAFNNVKNNFPNTRLLIVGKDRTKSQTYLQKIKDYIKKNDLKNNVILFGESSNIKEIMSISKFFILCAYWEGLSRVLLEAMACSKAILASKNGGNKEQVFDNVNGFTFEAGDIKILSDLLVKMHSINTAEFGKNSRKIAEEQFDIKITTQKIETLYNTLI